MSEKPSPEIGIINMALSGLALALREHMVPNCVLSEHRDFILFCDSGDSVCALSCTQSVLKIFEEQHLGSYLPRVTVFFGPGKEPTVSFRATLKHREGRSLRGVASEEYPMPKEIADLFICCRDSLCS